MLSNVVNNYGKFCTNSTRTIYQEVRSLQKNRRVKTVC